MSLERKRSLELRSRPELHRRQTEGRAGQGELARAEQSRAAMKIARERLTPLESRVVRLLEAIPAELQREGLSLPALQAALRGRQGGNVHAGELGVALRRLGFSRERRWRGGEGFRAVWRRTPME